MKRTTTIAVVIGTVMITFAPMSTAADSIYLKNGRVIRADDVHVDGDQLVFFLHGNHQAIPLALVERFEDDGWKGPGLPPDTPGASSAGAASNGSTGPADSGAASGVPALADIAPAARFDALAGFLGDGGEATQALGLLQALSGLQGGGGGAGGGLEALAPMLGALGGTGGGDALGLLGSLGSLGGDLEQVQAILPALTRLGAALFAPQYSAEATDAAARELLQGLSKMGVSDADIRAKARQFGVPEDVLARIGRH